MEFKNWINNFRFVSNTFIVKLPRNSLEMSTLSITRHPHLNYPVFVLLAMNFSIGMDLLGWKLSQVVFHNVIQR